MTNYPITSMKLPWLEQSGTDDRPHWGAPLILQEFLRGVSQFDDDPRVDEDVARDILTNTGFWCAAVRRQDSTPELAELALTPDSLRRHQSDNAFYRDHSPYISVTAGTYIERRWQRYNQEVFAFDTALNFAVNIAGTDGWIFYGYVICLGYSANGHAEFAEELRDVHQHARWCRYRAEGEFAAPVRIPPRRLSKAEHYSSAEVIAAVYEDRQPNPDATLANTKFMPPEKLLRARGMVSR
jgi:hypothetical protein